MSTRQKAFGVFIGAIIFMNGWFLIAHFQRPKESHDFALFRPTAGHAFNKGESVRLVLPAGWLARYNGHQPFREATLFDKNGLGQFELSIDIRKGAGALPISTALSDFAAVEKTSPNRQFISGAQKNALRGPAWWGVAQNNFAESTPLFIMDDHSPRNVPTVHFVGAMPYQGDLVVFRFRTTADNRPQREAQAWQIFTAAEYSKQ